MDQEKNEESLLNDIDYQLWITLDHLRYMIFKTRRQELSKYNITPEQAQVLYNLGQFSSLTLNKLVEYTQHQHHSISTLINRMVKKGLVSKTKIPGKGKKLEISISEQGQEVLDTIRRDTFGTIFACLSEEDKKEMINYMSRLLISSYKELGKEITPLCILNSSIASYTKNLLR
ncbi:MAG: MarR family transcriptional regulator [Dehalococcoidales bacterium]|nr:MarR family transcriptional regulator [Dehalococcoidales bacterium]